MNGCFCITLHSRKPYSSVRCMCIDSLRGVYSDTTQLNWTQLTQLNSVQPSQSCFCLWRHDLQTESTVVHAVELSSVELSCVAINGPLELHARNDDDSTKQPTGRVLQERLTSSDGTALVARPSAVSAASLVNQLPWDSAPAGYGAELLGRNNYHGASRRFSLIF